MSYFAFYVSNKTAATKCLLILVDTPAAKYHLSTGLFSSFRIDRLRYIDFSLHHRYFHKKKLDCVLNVGCSHVISALLWCFSFMSTGRGCKLAANYFCYVCGFCISPKHVKHNTVPGTRFCTV